MDHLASDLLAYITAHPELAAILVGATAFGESFAFINFIVPGGAVLIGAGALVQTGILDPGIILVAAVAGAVTGDAISYWLGSKFGEILPGMWPFRRHPEVLQRGQEFFKRYGHASVFIGRFFGPLRAIVPITAGITRMPIWEFMLSTFFSALIWAPALMGTGYLLKGTLTSGWSMEGKALVIGAGVALVGLGIWGMRRMLLVR